MIEMLHNEARKLLIEALEKKHKVQEVADCYSVNRSTVYRLRKRWEETVSFETRTFLRGRKPALSPEKLASIDQLVKDKPDVTLQEIVDTLHPHRQHRDGPKGVAEVGIPAEEGSVSCQRTGASPMWRRSGKRGTALSPGSAQITLYFWMKAAAIPT